jgi:enoyl-CoA hydratase/carnithine racemase
MDYPHRPARAEQPTMLTTIEHGPIRELRLDRPPANALSPELLGALRDAVRAAPEEGARALVLSGAEGMFSAGLDVPHFVTLERREVRTAWRTFFDLMEALIAARLPVACALTGHAPAGGCVLALSCHHRVMAAGAFKIGLNEVQVGVRVPLPILAAARHVVGARQAERLCTTAELIEPEEAHRIGLVDELVDVGEVVPRALAWAEAQLALPPETLRRTRALARRELARSFEVMDEEQLELFMDEWFGDECQEALQALVDRLAAR